MSVEIRVLKPGEEAALRHVARDVFDGPVDPKLAAEFVNDPRHHLAVAIEDGEVVGMVSGVHYVHPDKPAELWVNEVSVASIHRRRGVARALLDAIFARARELGCREAWVATEPDNHAARALYREAGGEECPEPFVMYNFPLIPRPYS